MSTTRPCSGMGCYPSRCAKGECVLDDACAAEGAQAPTTTGAGLTAQQLAALADCQRDPWLPLALAAGAAIAALLSYLYPMGFAA